VPAEISLPVPFRFTVAGTPGQITGGVTSAIAAGLADSLAGTLIESEHPVAVSETTSLNTSEEHTSAVVNCADGFAITLPFRLVHKYFLPAELPVPLKLTVVQPQNAAMESALARGNGFTVSKNVSTLEQVPLSPFTIKVVVTEGVTTCVDSVESAKAYGGFAVHAYIVAPEADREAGWPAQIADGPLTVILIPAITVKGTEMVSIQLVKASLTITEK
jgi:hypothetical protein